GLDQERCQVDRLQGGGADLVYGERGHPRGDAGLEGRLPGRDLALAGRDHGAHDALVHFVRSHPGALQGGPDDVGPQIHRQDRAERAAELAEGGAGRRHDHRVAITHEPIVYPAGDAPRAQLRSWSSSFETDPPSPSRWEAIISRCTSEVPSPISLIFTS